MLFLGSGGICRNLFSHLNRFRQKEVIFYPGLKAQEQVYRHCVKCNLENACSGKRMDVEAQVFKSLTPKEEKNPWS